MSGRHPASEGPDAMADTARPRFAVTRAAGGTDVAPRLLAHLRAHLDAPSLDYAEAPAPILGGFDTWIYRFSLNGGDPRWTGPLIARVFRAEADSDRARYETLVQNAIAALGYPAPEVLLAEEDAAALGSPFMIMRRIPGTLMFERLLSVRAPWVARLLGHAHARLHDLDAGAFQSMIGGARNPRGVGTFDPLLELAAETVARSGLDGLAPALAWLRDHRPAAGEDDVVCHGDFHPLNVLIEGNDCTGVLDWGWAGVGPAAFDVGATIALIGHGPIDVPRPLRPLVRGARSLITRWYVAGYRAARPLDMEQVRYFEVVRLLQFLCEAGEHIEAIAAGATPPFDSPFVPPEVRGGVIRRLRAFTGVPVSLPDARSAPKR